jgi:hypothetical protein
LKDEERFISAEALTHFMKGFLLEETVHDRPDYNAFFKDGPYSAPREVRTD